MYKSKSKRLRNISVEIAATCNAVFLVLALLILSSKFNTVAETRYIPIPRFESPEATIIITKNKVMFEMPDHLKDFTLSNIEEIYNFKLSEPQRNIFKSTSAICVPLAGLNSYLNTYDPKKDILLNKGIPCDTVTNELFNWVREARKAEASLTNRALKITIDAKEDALNSKVSEVIRILRKQKANIWNIRFEYREFGSCG